MLGLTLPRFGITTTCVNPRDHDGFVKAIRPEPWMGRTEKIEALVDPQLTPPVVEVR